MSDATRSESAVNAERSLLQLLRDGDEDAWNQVVSKNSRRLQTIARKMEGVTGRREGAEDILNSVFKSLYRRLKREDASSIEELSAFLKGMVDNKLKQRHARHFAQKRDVRRENYDVQALDDLKTKELTTVELQDEFRQIFDALSPMEQAVFELAFEGHSTLETARKLNYSQRSVQLCKSRIRKKVERLRVDEEIP